MVLKRFATLRALYMWLLPGLFLVGLCSLAAAQSESAPPPPPPPPDGMIMMHGPGPNMAFGPGPMGHVEIGEGKVVTGAPMSGDLIVTRNTTLTDGNTIYNQNQTKIYRDSQGRVRREIGFELNTPSTGEVKHNMVVITDPVAGYRYVLNPDNKTARQMPMKPLRPPKGSPEGPPVPPASEGNVATEQLGTKTINGLSAEGTRVTRTIPAGQIGNQKPIEVVTERWYSSDLQLPLMTKHSDPMMGTVTTQLTNINRAEPSAALFQVPSDYKIETGKGSDFLYMPMKP